MSFRYRPLHLQDISPTSNGCRRVDRGITWYRSGIGCYIGPTSEYWYRNDIKWHIYPGFVDVKVRYISDIGWSISFSQRNCGQSWNIQFNVFIYLFTYFYKCPLDEYVAVGSVDTRNSKTDMILAMQHFLDVVITIEKQKCRSSGAMPMVSTCLFCLHIAKAEASSSVTFSLSRALPLSLETGQLFICISQNKYPKLRNTA